MEKEQQEHHYHPTQPTTKPTPNPILILVGFDDAYKMTNHSLHFQTK